MSANIKKFEKSYYIKWAISIFLGAIFLFIPEQGVYTYNVKVFLAITVLSLALVAFELVGELVVGIALPSFYAFFNVASADVIFSPWVGTTMMLFMGGLFFAATLDDCGLLRRTALLIMCKAKGSYMTMLMGLLTVGIVLNFMTSGRAYIMIGPLGVGLCMALNSRGNRVGAAIALACMIGTCTSHVFIYAAGSWAVINKMGAAYISSNDITPLTMLIHCWPMIIVCFLTMFIIGKWYKPTENLPEVTYFQEELAKMGKMSREEKWNFVMMAIVMIYIFTTSIHGLDINYAFCLIPWMVYLPGINAATAQTLKKANIGTVVFAAGCMGIGTVASSLGLGGVLVEVLKEMMHGGSSPFMLITIVFWVVFALNFLMTPLAIFALITEPLFSLVTSLGFSPIPFAYAIAALSEAIILPYEYIPYLIIYAFGMIKMKDFIILNAFRSMMVFGGYLLLVVPYWMLIGLF